MSEVAPGDVILHYANNAVRAISSAATVALDTRRPVDLPDDLWDAEGRTVRASYRELAQAVALKEVPEEWRLEEPTSGPFQRDGRVKVGYLFPLSSTFFDRLTRTFAGLFEVQSSFDTTLPPEGRTGATDLLRRLIGQPLRTAAGRLNTVVSVQPPNVFVATERSPAGQPIPIEWIDNALDTLARDGAVIIRPDEIGHRSAFIGAVLLTLPGAQAHGSPPVVTIDRSLTVESNTTDTGLTFQGDLNRASIGSERGEQGPLRAILFGSATQAQCAICGDTFPVRFLWASHIKKRAVCNEDEQRDLQHIAMPACLFGCDALFESGYLSVDDDGHVIATTKVNASSRIALRLGELRGKRVSAHTVGSAPYFTWHRLNTFRE